MIMLFGGAAGSGKTTVARLWCKQQPRAVHIEFDPIRDLIVSGRADPQVLTEAQAHQYEASARACCALARSFVHDGFTVVVDEVFEPVPTRTLWASELAGLDARLVILHPSLTVAVARNASRPKRVMEHHIRTQHTAVAAWPEQIRVDSSNLDVRETVVAAARVLQMSSLVELLAGER